MRKATVDLGTGEVLELSDLQAGAPTQRSTPRRHQRLVTRLRRMLANGTRQRSRLRLVQKLWRYYLVEGEITPTQHAIAGVTLMGESLRVRAPKKKRKAKDVARRALFALPPYVSKRDRIIARMKAKRPPS